MDDWMPRRRLLEAAVTASAFGLAGCLRLEDGGGGGEPGTRTTTDGSSTTSGEPETKTTEEPAPEETTADPQADYPSGVSEDGVTPVAVQSHFVELADVPVTVKTKYMHRQSTAKLSPNATRVSPEEGVDVYVADGRTYKRYDVNDQTIWGYRDGVPADYERSVLAGEDVMRGLVRGCAFRPTGRNLEDGETVFNVAADEVEDADAFEGTRRIARFFRESEFPIRSVSGSGTISADGVITELTAFLAGDGDSGEFSVETSAVGSTRVSEPDWASTAKAERAQFESSFAADRNYVAVEQVGGQSIDTSFLRCEVDAYDDTGYYDGTYDGSFDGSIETGDRLYLYKTGEQTSDGSQEVGVTKNERPTDSPAEPWSGETRFNVQIDRFRLVSYRTVS